MPSDFLVTAGAVTPNVTFSGGPLAARPLQRMVGHHGSLCYGRKHLGE